MTGFKPLTKEDITGWGNVDRNKVFSALKGLKSAFVQDIVDEKKNCSVCDCYTQQHFWGRSGDSVCFDCWVDKWFLSLSQPKGSEQTSKYVLKGIVLGTTVNVLRMESQINKLSLLEKQAVFQYINDVLNEEDSLSQPCQDVGNIANGCLGADLHRVGGAGELKTDETTIKLGETPKHAPRNGKRCSGCKAHNVGCCDNCGCECKCHKEVRS